MNYRMFEYESGFDITTAGTKFINLKGDNPISALMFQIRLKGATGTPGFPADGALTRLKITDGSTVLYNTKGIACVPIHFNTFGVEPVHFNGFQNLIQNIATFVVPFGRYLGDPDYAFDPTKYSNPKLVIEYDDTGMGLGTNSTATMQIYAHMFDEKIPALKGFLGSKEVYAYTMTDSNVTVVELPVDHPIRTLMIQSRAPEYSVNSQYNSLKLSEDNDKHVMFDESTSNLIKLIYPQKQFTEHFLGETNGATQRVHYGYCCYESYMIPCLNLTNDALFQHVAYGPNIDLYSSSAVEVVGFRYGYCPNGLTWLPMGNPKDPTDWLQPRSDMDLDFKISASSGVDSGSTCEVIVQQEIVY